MRAKMYKKFVFKNDFQCFSTNLKNIVDLVKVALLEAKIVKMCVQNSSSSQNCQLQI
jgi:hypothetical protein